jgi:hypothetical protein
LGDKTGNIGFGNLTGSRPINAITTDTNTNATTIDQEDISTTNQYNETNTKIMKITLHTFERLQNHSRRYYNSETYDHFQKQNK